jgi:mRNA interferase MazF
MRRGEIWLGNLNPNRGAEIGKVRLVLIMQADFLIARRESRRSSFCLSRLK